MASHARERWMVHMRHMLSIRLDIEPWMAFGENKASPDTCTHLQHTKPMDSRDLQIGVTPYPPGVRWLHFSYSVGPSESESPLTILSIMINE